MVRGERQQDAAAPRKHGAGQGRRGAAHARRVRERMDADRGPARPPARPQRQAGENPEGDVNASPTVPVFRRPRRGGDRVLPQDARRGGADADALQGQPRAAAEGRPDAAGGQGDALVPAHRRHRDHGVGRLRPGQAELPGLRSRAQRARRRPGAALVRGARRRWPGAPAARQDLLQLELRHGHRPFRPDVDGVRSAGQKIMKEPRYGWVMVALGAFMTCIAVGAMFSLAVFLQPITQATGWSHTAVSTAMTLNFLAMGAAGFGWGALSDRIGPRPVVLAGAVLLGLGLFLASRAQSPLQFQLAFGLLVGIAVGSFFSPMIAAVMGWISEHRGLAVSLVSVGVGVAPMTMSPFAAWLITQMDWRAAQVVLAVLVWATLVPAALFARRPPAAQPGTGQGASEG